MRKTEILTAFLLATASLISFNAVAQEDPRAEDRLQLRAMMGDIEQSLNDHNLSDLQQYLHPDVVVTFQDSTVVQGYEELEAYYDEKLGGAAAVLENYSTSGDVDAPAIFHGDIAVAYGHANDRFDFRGGKVINITTRWTATLKKTESGWQVIALHFSGNLFDNPLINEVKSLPVYSGIAGLAAGMLLAGLFFALRRRRKTA